MAHKSINNNNNNNNNNTMIVKLKWFSYFLSDLFCVLILNK